MRERMNPIYPGDKLLKMSTAFIPVKDPNGAEWFLSTDGPKFFFHPYPFPQTLWRGQNQHFQPNLPSISRKIERNSSTIGAMTEEDQAKVVLSVAKSHWFANELKEHPGVIWANNKNLRINEIALAQHYELETG